VGAVLEVLIMNRSPEPEHHSVRRRHIVITKLLAY
jgi:hypothetical protein